MRRAVIVLLVVILIGLFAFAVGREQTKHFDVVFTDGAPDGAALDDLLYVIAARHAYGDRDNALAFPDALERLSAGGLQQQCGQISTTALDLLTLVGYRARLVALLTGDAWNGCDDGHVALEVWHPDFERWLLVDFSTDRLYMQTVGEFSAARGVYRRLTNAPMADGYVTPCTESPLAAGDVDTWYDRIAQIPLIYAGGVWYADAGHPLAVRAREYGYRVVGGWHERFYGEAR